MMMRALSALELLEVCARGMGQPLAQRALTLLAAAFPDVSPEELARQSIGRRDASLLRLREWTFGQRMISQVTCPCCDERLELEFNVSDIMSSAEAKVVEDLSLSLDGYELRFRLANSLDLADAPPEATAAHRHLVQRCVLDARRHGIPTGSDQLPRHVIDAMSQRMTAADPQSDVRLAMTCPACSHKWSAIFDIVSFFWSEIEAWGKRTLREVHRLASAYGWSEAKILGMSAWRRQSYLAMVG